MNRVELQQALENRFTVEELRLLCFVLEIKHENLSPQLSVLARELVEYCERANKIDELIAKCKEVRPKHADWNYSSEPSNFPLPKPTKPEKAKKGFTSRRWSKSVVKGLVLVLLMMVLVVSARLLAKYAPSLEVRYVDVTITDPEDEAIVTQRYAVKGTVSDPTARIYVLVRPMDRNDYYVQPIPVIKEDNSWEVLAGFGTEELGLGIRYQAIAFATLDELLFNLRTGYRYRPNEVIQTIPEEVDQLESTSYPRLRLEKRVYARTERNTNKKFVRVLCCSCLPSTAFC